MRVLVIAQLIMLLIVSASTPSRADDSSFPEGTLQHVVLAADVAWKPCPPNLPDGCEIAVLEGNPQSPNFFTVRFRLSEQFVMPPHTHPKDERVTVLQGKVSVAIEGDGSRKDARQFGPGDYYVNMRGVVHAVWGDELTVLQITGVGPWEAHFVEQDKLLD
jgi:quercetin dioxygenase-like cupin family protein